ncbi:MAG: hypothetical protein ACRCZA_14255, partial [Shewanella sp.]|uniref:hypothetical protein n=1 Tax=Shewanella sp. TaxID=50422 RepID=UPI003F318EC6
MPFTARQAHYDVLHRAQHLPAVAIEHPIQLWQEYPAVGLVEFATLRVAETIALALLLKAGEIRPFGEEVAVGPN